MIQSVFGDLQFNTGWKTNDVISFFGKEYSITIKARAYSEADGITEEQKESFSNYKSNSSQLISAAESLLTSYASNNDADEQFTPKTLLFDRNGECALLCDDKSDPDNGIAIVLWPEQKLLFQDDYL